MLLSVQEWILIGATWDCGSRQFGFTECFQTCIQIWCFYAYIWRLCFLRCLVSSSSLHHNIHYHAATYCPLGGASWNASGSSCQSLLLGSRLPFFILCIRAFKKISVIPIGNTTVLMQPAVIFHCRQNEVCAFWRRRVGRNIHHTHTQILRSCAIMIKMSYARHNHQLMYVLQLLQPHS